MQKSKVKNQSFKIPLKLAVFLFFPFSFFILIFSIIKPAFSQQGLPGHMPASGLVSLWLMDGDVLDAAAGHHGSLEGGAGFAPGLFGQALHLDGVDDFFNIPAHPSLDFGAGDFSVSLWVNFDDVSGEYVLIEKYVEGDLRAGWTLAKISSQTLRFAGPLPGNGSIMDVSFASPLPVHTWIHFVVVRSGNNFLLYRDGELAGTATATADLNSSASLKIGHRGSPSDTPGSTDTRGFYLKGLVDEL